MGEENINRLAKGKPWSGMALLESGNASGNICVAAESMGGSGAYLKCLHTNTGNMRNKPDEVKALVIFQNCDITGIRESWWNEYHSSFQWGARMEDYRLFSKDKEDRWDGGLALYCKGLV